MTRPVNLYAISRIRDEESFNHIEMHQSQRTEKSRIQKHEIDSLRRLVDQLMAQDLSVQDMDSFFFSFHIPQIGKEFDLLKSNGDSCLNIELKSQPVPEKQILAQLLKNRYYLSHLGIRLALFTVETSTMSCYKLSEEGSLLPSGPKEVADAVKQHSQNCLDSIDPYFRPSEYLVSPLTTPDKFIRGEYFLTQAQEQVKLQVLQRVGQTVKTAYFHITGNPGTGKTLLIYDIAKALALIGRTVIIHCEPLSEEQLRIDREIEGLRVIPAGRLSSDEKLMQEARFLLIDESHRILEEQFRRICQSAEKNGQVCIFCTDPEQVLTTTEKQRNIVGHIRELPLAAEFLLSEKLRTNKEMMSFILCLKNLNHEPEQAMNYLNVELNSADTTEEARNLLAYYRSKDYVFINYSRPENGSSPYADFEEDFDTHHVAGREFKNVVMLMDDSFYYDENGALQGIPHPDPDYLYPNLFYQGVTRVQEKLALIVLKAPELFRKISSIVG